MRSQDTDMLIAAHKKLNSNLPDKFYASGITVSLKALDGQPICPSFTVNGETFGDAAIALSDCIEYALAQRMPLLECELDSIKKVLAGKNDNSGKYLNNTT